MIAGRLWLLVSCRSFEAKPIVRGDRSNCLCEASLVGDKTWNNSLLFTSATLASLYEGLLCFSVLTYFSKARIFHAAIENSQLLQYGHAYQLNDRTNVKTMDARTRVLWNGAKTETFAPQNDRAMERNVNFLLTATVTVSTRSLVPRPSRGGGEKAWYPLHAHAQWFLYNLP